MRTRVAALALGMLAAVGAALPVYAQVPTPTPWPTPSGPIALSNTMVYRGVGVPAGSCVYDGTDAGCDWLIVTQYDIPYLNPPVATPTPTGGPLPQSGVSNAFVLRLTDGTGTTIALNTLIGCCHQRGANTGVASIYLTAAQTASLTWGDTDLQLRLDATQPSFPAPPTSAVATPLAYDDATDKGTAQSHLAMLIIAIAQSLTESWGIELIGSSSLQGLNVTGETYFTQAIPGLRAMAPDAFATQTAQPVATVFPTPTGTPFGYSINNTFGPSDGYGHFLDNIGALFSWPRALTATVVTLLLFCVLVGFCIAKLRDSRIGLLIGFPVWMYGAYLGVPLQVHFLLMFACFGLLMHVLFWR